MKRKSQIETPSDDVDDDVDDKKRLNGEASDDDDDDDDDGEPPSKFPDKVDRFEVDRRGSPKFCRFLPFLTVFVIFGGHFNVSDSLSLVQTLPLPYR